MRPTQTLFALLAACLAVLLGLLSPTAALAQAGADCRPKGSTPEVLACAVREAQWSDSALQLRYGEQMQQAPASERTQLRKAHTTWMRERDRRCRQSADAHAGPEWALQLQRCLTQENQARQTELDAHSAASLRSNAAALRP